MVTELILTYFLLSNSPATMGMAYPTKGDCRASDNCLMATLQVHSRKQWDTGLILDMKPYVSVDQDVIPRRAGAEVFFGWGNDVFEAGLYHHSSHNLDEFGNNLSLDGFRLTWKIN